jgi:hypothetical protein
MQTAKSDEQLENAPAGRNKSLEPDSNATVERASQSEKHSVPRYSTAEGMQIDESDEHLEKVRCSIDESREPDANVTVEREPHPEKHPAPSFSTDDGMQIDDSELFSNAVSPIDLILESHSTMRCESVSESEKQLVSISLIS